jgi:hypothetical protein
MKRFTSLEKWSDSWYRHLTPRLKCLWDWLFTNCDMAGSIYPDWDLASFQIGETVSEADISAFGDRIVTLKSGRLWLSKFIEFQYVRIDGKSSKVHQAIRETIDRLCIPYGEPMDRLQEKEKEKDSSLSSLGSCSEEEGMQGEKQAEAPSWRTSFPIYKAEAERAFDALYADLYWLADMRLFHPGTMVRRTLERMWVEYWGTEEGWAKKKQGRGKAINWKSTIQKTYKLSAVYLPRGQDDEEGKWLDRSIKELEVNNARKQGGQEPAGGDTRLADAG